MQKISGRKKKSKKLECTSAAPMKKTTIGNTKKEKNPHKISWTRVLSVLQHKREFATG